MYEAGSSKQSLALLVTGFLFGLLFNPEDEGNMFLRHFG
jgi:hypothetical protein